MQFPVDIIPVDFASPAYDASIDLRDRILRQPLGLEFTTKDLAQEYDQIHLVAYDKNYRLCGVLVLKRVGRNQVKMRQVAVPADLQGRGVGQQLVAAAEQYCRAEGWTKIELNARDVAIPFYEKLAYKKKGKPFLEVGIEHYRMEKQLKPV